MLDDRARMEATKKEKVFTSCSVLEASVYMPPTHPTLTGLAAAYKGLYLRICFYL